MILVPLLAFYHPSYLLLITIIFNYFNNNVNSIIKYNNKHNKILIIIFKYF